MILSTVEFVINSHISARIHFAFLKNVLKETWNSFNAKFQPQSKDRKSSYQERQSLALFCKLFALILGQNSMKGLRVTKIVKETKFEGVWGELESTKGFERQ